MPRAATILIGLACLAVPPAAWAGEVMVELTSGRELTGQFDPTTDEQALWLRSGAGRIEVRRPIQWQAIESIHYQGRGVSLSEARRQLPAWTAERLANTASPIRPVAAQVEIPPPAASESLDDQFVAPAEFPRMRARPVPAEVRSLSIDAWVSNWDADVEADGIELHIRPLNRANAVAAVAGTLHVELLGDERGFLHRGKPFHRLGSWTQQVSPADFTLHGAVYRLPFQAIHPEYHLEVSPYALVNVRLAIPGTGVVSASQADLRIRPYSIVRERVQQVTGQRFLPGEQTGRGLPTQAQVRP